MKVTNNGLAAEALRLFIDGIPTGWVSTPSPVTELEPGEEKEILVTISPPRASESLAGRQPVTFRLVSQQNPDQAVTQECVLTIGTFTNFRVNCSQIHRSKPIKMPK